MSLRFFNRGICLYGRSCEVRTLFYLLSSSYLVLVTCGAIAGSLSTWDPASLAVSLLIALLAWGLAAGLVATLSPRGERTHNRFPFVVVVVLCLGCVISVIATQWPVRVAFMLSRVHLNDLAKRIDSGYVLEQPQRAGLFWIQQAGRTRDGIVYLWTDPSPDGPRGFVRCSPSVAVKSFNTWIVVRLDQQWQLMFQD